MRRGTPVRAESSPIRITSSSVGDLHTNGTLTYPVSGSTTPPPAPSCGSTCAAPLAPGSTAATRTLRVLPRQNVPLAVLTGPNSMEQTMKCSLDERAYASPGGDMPGHHGPLA